MGVRQEDTIQTLMWDPSSVMATAEGSWIQTPTIRDHKTAGKTNHITPGQIKGPLSVERKRKERTRLPWPQAGCCLLSLPCQPQEGAMGRQPCTCTTRQGTVSWASSSDILTLSWTVTQDYRQQWRPRHQLGGHHRECRQKGRAHQRRHARHHLNEQIPFSRHYKHNTQSLGTEEGIPAIPSQ